MSEFILQGTSLLLSKTPEADFNELKTDGADFLRLQTRGNPIALPRLGKTDTLDLIGAGNEFATEPLHVQYWEHPVLALSGDVDFDLLPYYAARVFGGTNAAPSTVATTCKEHILKLQTDLEGRQLPSSNFISSIGYVDDDNPGADVQWTGVVPESLQISQSRADSPVWQVEFVGSGGFARPVDEDVRADLPVLVGDDTANHKDMWAHGAAVVVQYTDGSTYNLATAGRIRSWNFQFNNNLRRDDRRPGDPFRIANDPTSGAYVNRLLRGRRSCGAQIVVSMDEAMEEFVTATQNRVVDNLTFLMKGQLIAGASAPTNYAFEIKMPKAQLRDVTPGNENDDATLTLDWYMLKGSGEYVTARVVNKHATSYV
jgi:hypothetical protein